MFVRDRTLETYLFFTISIGCREEVYHTILPSEPVSGSMDCYAKFLIQFIYGMQQELREVEVAVFSTLIYPQFFLQ